MKIPNGHTRESLLACVDREIRLRERVYPNQVQLGKMSGANMRAEISAMRAIREVLTQLPEAPPRQPGLFPGDRRDRT